MISALLSGHTPRLPVILADTYLAWYLGREGKLECLFGGQSGKVLANERQVVS